MDGKKDRIQIKPGVWIEVSARLRKASGLGPGVRIRNRLEDEERKRIMGDTANVVSKNVKYSRLLLDEASRLADEVGLTQAAKATKVNVNTLRAHRKLLVREGKRKGGAPGKSRYTLGQKRKCVLLAQAIADKKQCGLGPAFVEAGQKLGVNGRSIAFQWRQRHFQL